MPAYFDQKLHSREGGLPKTMGGMDEMYLLEKVARQDAPYGAIAF